MKKAVLILISILISMNSYSEIIDGPANVRLAPNKKIQFELSDGVRVGIGYELNGWYHVCTEGAVDDKDSVQLPPSTTQYGMVYIAPNTTLFSPFPSDKYKPIGKTHEELAVSVYEAISTMELKRTPILICGYTHKNNIEEGQKLEENITTLLHKSGRSYAEWQVHLNTYRYRLTWSGMGGDMEVYTVPAYETIGRPRIFLFFYLNVLGIISHKQEFWKRRGFGMTEKGTRGYKLLFLNTFPIEKKKEFKKWYQKLMTSWG